MSYEIRQMRSGVAETFIVVTTIILGASAPYLFIGPIAIYNLSGVVAFLMAIKRGILLSALFHDREVFFFCIFWVLLIIFIFLMDLLSLQDRAILRGAVLIFVNLVVFLGIMACTAVANLKIVISWIFVVIALQGSIALCQFMGIAIAWEIPNTIMQSAGPFATQNEIYNSKVEDFTLVSRARGTHQYIHIFSAVQGALVSCAIFWSIHSEEYLSSVSKLLRVIAVVLGALGLLVTFSRSGLLAMTLATVVALFFQSSAQRLLWSVVGVSLIIIGASALAVFDSVMVSRLLAFDPTLNTNASRFEHLHEAYQSILKNPLYGNIYEGVAIKRELPIHSVILRYAHDYGLLGFTLYLACIACIAARFIRQRFSAAGPLKFVGGTGLVLLFAILSDSWTHSSGYLRGDILHSILLGVVFGMGINIQRSLSHVRGHGV